jgi:uncharacterized protein
MLNGYELRTSADLRATDDGKLVGYAAVFGALSEDLGAGLREVIAPGAFTRTLREFPDILALVEHDTGKVLARTTNGTLRIAEDERGLSVEIDPANTSYARDLIELVRRGDVAGMSFRFKPFPGGASLDMGQSPPLRTLHSVRLREVTVTVSPAYPDTSVALRDIEAARTDQIKNTHRRLRLQLAERI